MLHVFSYMKYGNDFRNGLRIRSYAFGSLRPRPKGTSPCCSHKCHGVYNADTFKIIAL